MDRLAIHAALADEHRLAIADALVLGDNSPGDLAEILGMSSNLMAHHLRVLEQARVVRRLRSEGDRRRSYVRLRLRNPVVAATVGVRPLDPVDRVVFVCTHNSARSQMAAAALAQRTSVPVASAGTDPASAIHPLALRTLDKKSLTPLAAAPQHVAEVLRPGDLVISVCDNAYEELSADPGTAPALHWSVPDPAPATHRKPFAGALKTMTPKLDRLAEAIS